MTKSQHKRTAAASMFQNGISRNTKCAVRDGFRRDSHKLQDARTKYLGKAMFVNSICLHGTQFKLMKHFGMV